MSYEFKSTNYEFRCTSTRNMKSMKSQVNSRKTSSFPNIPNHKFWAICEATPMVSFW